LVAKKRRSQAARSPRSETPPLVLPTSRRTTRIRLLAGSVIGVAAVALAAFGLATRTKGPPPAPIEPPLPSFVGTNTCASCHAAEAKQWGGSQHGAAMAAANERTVLGDFNDVYIEYAGVRSRFFRRDGKYFVHTDGADGKLADFEVRYTFGVQPLQQYLIALPQGRLQAFSIAWDTRPKSEHGQRWFPLRAGEWVTHTDELHWTQPSQNWNYMCADCHSTGLRKNYERTSDQFRTSWSEVSVGCEACHGPGSRHVQWARAGGSASADATKGLIARLDERRGVRWTPVAATGNAQRSRPRTSDREIETCAQCHSRRTQIADGYVAGKPFLDYYRPALLGRPLYHADGQQHDEVYDWGSFLQSRMYAKGVTCSDCHNPHSGKLEADGNAVCATCHLPAKYDGPRHTHHQVGSTGATCAGCHMPTTTYMVVDPRHDHSLRVPRPALSVKLGTPNACTSCHTTRDAKWAAAQAEAWYGQAPAPGPHERLAATLAAVDANAPDAQAQLRTLANDPAQSRIARATALAELTPPPGGPSLDALRAALNDSSGIVRFGALQAAERLPGPQRLSLVEPLLADPLRVIRIEAVRQLAGVPVEQLAPERQYAFQRAATEFVESQRYNADRPEARVALGTFLAERGDAPAAESELLSAIRLAPSSIPAYVNLADVYRAIGRDAEGENVLRTGLQHAPQSGALHHALGLVLTRLQARDSALRELSRAAALEPGNARFAYVNAIALHSSGRADAAIAQLRAALRLHPVDGDIISALADFYRQRGDSVQAMRYSDRLRTLSANR
jgi:Tfp pilus assembly protein PilF